MTLPIRLTLTVLGAFFLTHFLGRWYIPFLHKLHFGQTIYDLGPAHQSKQGTPIMGGMMAALAALVFVLLLHGPVWHGFWDASVGLLGVSLLSMLVGFADDFIKSVKKRHDGLTPWQKIAGQVLPGRQRLHVHRGYDRRSGAAAAPAAADDPHRRVHADVLHFCDPAAVLLQADPRQAHLQDVARASSL